MTNQNKLDWSSLKKIHLSLAFCSNRFEKNGTKTIMYWLEFILPEIDWIDKFVSSRETKNQLVNFVKLEKCEVINMYKHDDQS